MDNKAHKVFCFINEERGRDVEILLPLVFFAERFLNCSVEFKFVWEIHTIYTQKPDLILLPNTQGNHLYFEISQYAHKQGIKVFALISEGNYRTDGTFNFWGYNERVKKFYQDFICHWSKRAYDFFLSQIPQFKEQIVFTGASGFDRYSIYDFATKQSYLSKKGLGKFKKVIGYAGWSFGKLYNDIGKKELLFFFKNDHSRLQWVEDQMFLVEGILKQLIEDNPDILFVLKKHPKQAHEHILGEGINEMIRLRDYNNVLYINTHEDIHDIISISDIWLGFETTTAIENWVMGARPTILINPDPDFTRTQLYKGCVLAKDAPELQQFIDEFYNTGKVESFNTEERKNHRKKLIEDSIGFGDGMNHMRCAYYLQKTVDTLDLSKRKVQFSFRYFGMYMLLHLGKFFYNKKVFSALPKFSKTVWIFERYRLKNIRTLQKKYKPFMEAFYEKHKVDQKFSDGTLFHEIVPELKH